MNKAGKGGAHAGKGKEPGSPEWAAAVVKKAMPKITESLIKAAQQCSESKPKAENDAAGGQEGEPLANLLLRLLRNPKEQEAGSGE